MFEFISLKYPDEILLEKYFHLSEEINRKYYPDTHSTVISISEFKKQLFAGTSADENELIILITYNNVSYAWLECSVWDNILYCKFEYISGDYDEVLFKSVLAKISEIKKDKNCLSAELIIYREPLIKWMQKMNVPVSEKILFSKLDRKDMNIVLYNEIINSSGLNDLKLSCYNIVPEELIVKFVETVNSCIKDKEALNEFQHDYPPLTPDEWYKDKQELTAMGIKLEILVLSDNTGNIAGICWVCIDSGSKNVVRHNGGFTAVNRSFRGRGIVRFLKAKLYLKLLNENKDFSYITTDTMPWNKYMYKINEEFGFKPYRNGCVFTF
ncbi:MAG: hypothetical protein J0M37_06860 [Ignavibacteria bacterium]|nr:hypothetical protein [Ignavibacteria bacterium]